MNTRGFALLTVLWVLVALSALAGAALAAARTGSLATRNRVLLARAGWAREACVEILLARYGQDSSVRALAAVDLGRGTWCRATLEDPGAKLNLNLADRAALVAVLVATSRRSAPSVDSLADALLDWRHRDTIPQPFGWETPANRHDPLADVAELRYVHGYDAALVAKLAAVFTTRGTGTIDVAAAPAEVLVALPGMSAEAVATVVDQRAVGLAVRNGDELLELLSPGARTVLLESYPEFLRAATFAPTELVAVVEGGVGETPIVSRVTVTVVPVAGRLAVVRRETE